jgi:hypothetical protein
VEDRNFDFFVAIERLGTDNLLVIRNIHLFMGLRRTLGKTQFFNVKVGCLYYSDFASKG